VPQRLLRPLYACADYAPIVGGPKDITYTQDLAECRTLAKQRSYTNGDVKSDALLGAGIRAVPGGGRCNRGAHIRSPNWWQ
jgi:hypothetical protein